MQTDSNAYVQQKYTNLDFLRQLTKGNQEMIMEMVRVYLEETPKLVNKIKQGIDTMDWDLLARGAHSIIPSFSTMGMNKEFAGMAKTIQDHAEKREKLELIKELFLKIEIALLEAHKELEKELNSK